MIIQDFAESASKFHHTSSNLKSSLIEVQEIGSLSPKKRSGGLNQDLHKRLKPPFRSIVALDALSP